MTTEPGSAKETAKEAVEGVRHGTVQPGGKDATAPKPSDRLPPAGPHANPALQNPDATPGAGTITPSGGHDDVDSTSS